MYEWIYSADIIAHAMPQRVNPNRKCLCVCKGMQSTSYDPFGRCGKRDYNALHRQLHCRQSRAHLMKLSRSVRGPLYFYAKSDRIKRPTYYGVSTTTRCSHQKVDHYAPVQLAANVTVFSISQRPIRACWINARLSSRTDRQPCSDARPPFGSGGSAGNRTLE